MLPPQSFHIQNLEEPAANGWLVGWCLFKAKDSLTKIIIYVASASACLACATCLYKRQCSKKTTSTTTSAETGNSSSGSSKIITSIATFKCNQRLCSNISRNIAYVAPQTISSLGYHQHPILAATLCYAATATEAGEFNI